MADPEQTHMQRPKAELGCWTLVIIAIIVMIFSGTGDSRKVRRKVETLTEKVEQLEKKIDTLIALQSRNTGVPPAGPATSTPTTATTSTTSTTTSP
jgi:hypothetical protein